MVESLPLEDIKFCYTEGEAGLLDYISFTNPLGVGETDFYCQTYEVELKAHTPETFVAAIESELACRRENQKEEK